MKEVLEPVVIEELAKLEYDLVELRLGGSKNRRILDVRIDRRDLQKVSVDDCARASRALEARLDAEPGLAGQRYVLEVSSPGIDRKLVRAEDWKRFAGRKVNVNVAALGGRREVEIIGFDGAAGEEVVTVRDAAGAEHRIALAEIGDARLAVHWS
jgi:ribosome maturation factor RimP